MSDEPEHTAKVAPLRKPLPCPECGHPSHREHYPFCSDRCRTQDLSRWLKGSYAIPVTEDESNPDDDGRF
ncbi:DNA gyrase inhibitor YacG [Agrobacterium vitis]|uniref:DNA gyrase inhibitor YacG n=1 Tax=Agrobacterium vitis TaxID=373 RepID=A0A6L6VJ45_AGRVI|nr:DNA gyrase inhibitor YacG [Agrobacterium vitis]MUZ75850.1 DNA gyrase inhibitor YacG [Agrobacterium vitis]